MCKTLSISLPKKLKVMCKQVEAILLVSYKRVEIIHFESPSAPSLTCKKVFLFYIANIYLNVCLLILFHHSFLNLILVLYNHFLSSPNIFN